jgi:Ca2+-binding RTX toxin-like protein
LIFFFFVSSLKAGTVSLNEKYHYDERTRVTTERHIAVALITNIEAIPMAINPTPILGTTGNDQLNGTVDDDTIIAYGGDDTLAGGLGNDTLTGGLGIDTFVVASGVDTITDLTSQDILQVSAGATANATLGAAFNANATNLQNNGGSVNFEANGFTVNLSAITTGATGYSVRPEQLRVQPTAS